MRSTAITGVFLFFSIVTFAQRPNLDHLMKRRMMRCDEIQLNCALLIPEYYRAGKIDSVRLLLLYWKNRCNENEPISRTELLLDLKEHKFSERAYGKKLFNILLDYQTRRNFPCYHYYDPRDKIELNTTRTSVGETFDRFAQALAGEIKSQYPVGSLEALICEFLMSNYAPLMIELQGDRFRGTVLKEHYDQALAVAKRIVDFQAHIFTGIWIPNGRLKFLGSHMLAGYSFGMVHKNFACDATLSFTFGKSRNVYSVYDNDGNQRDATDFAGYSILVEPGYTILRGGRSELYLTAGFGSEKNMAFRVKGEERSVYTGALGGNIGTGFRYFLDSEGAFCSLQLRFHVYDYATGGGTDLDGNVISLRLSIGGINPTRKSALGKLYYRGN